MTERPADVVDGPDPAFTMEEITTQAFRCTCGYVELKHLRMEEHLHFAHSAGRNPKLTCHAAPMWDHERWCVRAKGHEGNHWTPSMNGGREWPNREGNR